MAQINQVFNDKNQLELILNMVTGIPGKDTSGHPKAKIGTNAGVIYGTIIGYSITPTSKSNIATEKNYESAHIYVNVDENTQGQAIIPLHQVCYIHFDTQ